MQPTADMVQYYAERAGEYERIYQRPERQADLARMKAAIETAFAGRRVLDIACGTGYFSACAARRAESLHGMDANEATLELARAKGLRNATFSAGDAYALQAPHRPYSGVLCTFWWSHVPRSRLESFLTEVARQAAPNAMVLFADNAYVEGNSTPIVRTDPEGNTYQRRRLENGAAYEVLKNFPTAAELVGWGMRFGTAVELRRLEHYWMLRFRVR